MSRFTRRGCNAPARLQGLTRRALKAEHAPEPRARLLCDRTATGAIATGSGAGTGGGTENLRKSKQ